MRGRTVTHIGRRLTAAVALVVAVGLTAACSSPAQRLDNEAAKLGLERQLLQSNEFPHVIYRNQPSGSGDTLHVYLEGDGVPWIAHRWESLDPTPDAPVMLRLLALDAAPSIYLGRPCYNGLAETPPCRPTLWTSARYSKRVVGSMAAVLQGVVSSGSYQAVVLMGHSGGGTLAMLLAEQVPQTRVVVTLAGNLDTDAWTVRHGYSPLTDSLNPARRPPLRADIRQLHLAGALDTNIPPATIIQALAAQRYPEVVVLDGFDHTCCWATIWPQVLETVALSRPFPRRVSGN